MQTRHLCPPKQRASKPSPAHGQCFPWKTPKFSFLAKPQLFHLTDLNLLSCWTCQEDGGAGRVKGKSPRSRFQQGWVHVCQPRTCSPCSCSGSRAILMPHPISSSGGRSDSRLPMYAWHTPVPISDGLIDVSVPPSCVKPHPPGTNLHFSCSTQLQKAKGKLRQAKSTWKSQGFITRGKIFQTAGQVSA